MHATYLAAPTDWCPASEGVPLVIAMDGPDIINGPDDWPPKVRVRRAGEPGDTQINGDRIDLDGPVIGRFSAKLRGCQSPWRHLHLDGTWTLADANGSPLKSGVVKEYWGQPTLLFFRRINRSSDAYFAKIGEDLLYAPERPQVTATQMFTAEQP